MLSASHHCRYGELRTGSSVPMITTAVWFSTCRGGSVGTAICCKILRRLGLQVLSEGRKRTKAVLTESAGTLRYFCPCTLRYFCTFYG